MRTFISKTALACGALALLATAARATTPVTTAFTYQGQLDDSGAPTNGAFDFDFRLYDALSGGAQVGADVFVNDLVVSNGLFTAQLNFGSVFNGTALWLEIGVRPGASVGPYTTLTPRQSLTATPFALYSLNDAFWQASGSAISNKNAGFVGINRTTQVSGAEAFGIQSHATGTNYGGMYIRTDSATAKPFYGYSNGATSCWTYMDGTTGDWRLYNGGDRVTVDNTGAVGIGTTSPGARLHVVGSTGEALYATATSGADAAQFYVPGGSSTMPLYAVTYGTGRAALFEAHVSNTTSTVYIYKNGGPALQVTGSLNGGTPDSAAAVSILGGTDTQLAGGGFLVLGSVASANISIDNNEIEARNNGVASPLYLNNDGGDVYIAPNGTAHVRVLEITGADVAEKFPVSDLRDLKPGLVVMIDAANPGTLCLAQGAYNKKVAGVISGGNGLPAGTILGHLPGSEDAPPIALSGRVWVYCDAASGAIEAGDFLTTSETPGYAMKAADEQKLHGAVIGKAMTTLRQGEKGMVLVLVNLQ